MRIRTVATHLLAFAVGGAIALTIGYVRWNDKSDPFEFRRWVTMNRAAFAPADATLLFGDSIVERAYLPTLCGRPTFNAGLSSSKTVDQLPMMDDLIATTRPRWIVVSTGVNDVIKGVTLAEWKPNAKRIVAVAGAHGIILGISSESGDVKPFNDFLRAEVRAAGGTFIEPLSVNLTNDGVHPNRRGYAEMVRSIDSACGSSGRI
jgi:hypothetical protein